MTTASDVELLQTWRAGDTSAGEELLERYFLPVYRFFAAHVTTDVDELTQRTFEACIAGRDRIRDDAAFRSYLFGIARHQLLKHFEHRASQRVEVPISQVEPQMLESSPSRAFARIDEQRLVVGAMAQLPDDVRPALELFYLDGRSLREVADELGVPLGTVKSRLFRGRSLLRAAIEAMANDDGLRRATLEALDRAADAEGEEKSSSP